MLFFLSEKKILAWKKIEKSAREKEKSPREKNKKQKSVRETKKVPENVAKISKKYPWNRKSVREKSEKSVRESNFFAHEKKPKKKAQNGFHAHFWFSREKKTLKGSKDFLTQTRAPRSP